MYLEPSVLRIYIQQCSHCSLPSVIYMTRPQDAARLYSYLHIPAPGHLREVFLLFKGLIYFIICHTEAPQPGFNRVVWFGKDYKFGHIWYTDNFSIHLRCKGNRFLNLSTIYQPEPTKRKKTSYLKFKVCILKKKISSFNMINIATKCFLKKKRERKRSKRNKDSKEDKGWAFKSGGIKKERYIRFLRLLTMKREYAQWTINT